jgi:hypothetical protein
VNDRAFAPWLQAALCGAAVIAVAEAAIRLHHSAVISRLLADPTLGASNSLAVADRRVEAIEVADGWWLVVTAVVFMVWTGLAYRDLVRSGARHRMPTALAVVAPFVPVAGLALTPVAMDDLTRQGRFPRTVRVAWWFGAWVIATVVRFTTLSATDVGTLAEHQRGDRIIGLSAIPQVVAAVLLVFLVGAATERAAERRRGATAVAEAETAVDPAAMDRALGWYRDPRRQAEVRWWDGVDWTVHVASSRQAPPPVVRGRARAVVN